MAWYDLVKTLRGERQGRNLRRRSGVVLDRFGKCSRRRAFEALEERRLLAADMVLEWNDVLLDAIRADRTAPPIAARNMAIVHLAAYDAVNSILQTHESYAVNRNGPRGASLDAAVAAAAYTTLVELFPNQTASFDAALTSSLAQVPDGSAENQGVALGRSVAQRMLALRRHDGWNDTVAYAPGNEPGDWQPTAPGFQAALLPHWPAVTPFAMTSAAQFRPDAPPEVTSAEYATDFNEVKDLGELNSVARTADQTEIALFWADNAGTATPPGHWNEIAQDVATAQGTSLAENARLFALLNMALADAGINAWDAKFAYDFWRPITGIRQADLDDNAATEADSDWTPLIGTPPFPSYTSGHSTFSSAAATVLASFFGTDEIAFTTSSDGLPGVSRSYASFSEAADEAGRSRIYGGIHWQFDNVAGLAAGSELAEYAVQNFLRPNAAIASAIDPLSLANSAAEQERFVGQAIATQVDQATETPISRKPAKPGTDSATQSATAAADLSRANQSRHENHRTQAVDAVFGFEAPLDSQIGADVNQQTRRGGKG